MAYKNIERLGECKLNNQGCLMKIVEYKDCEHIIVEFEDEYRYNVNTRYASFKLGTIKNPYYPYVEGIGITGIKYPTIIDGKITKEYDTWRHMLQRCFVKEEKEKRPTYKDVTCCDEWLLYENFYEWLHSQENFEKWKKLKLSAIDKDIKIKNNKIYSPDTCFLVPHSVNLLFVRNISKRNDLPIGVSHRRKKYYCQFSVEGQHMDFSLRSNIEDCFYLDYKPTKEYYIKLIAKREYDCGNISKECYNAMINYKVEITD